jgi:polyferredoxin
LAHKRALHAKTLLGTNDASVWVAARRICQYLSFLLIMVLFIGSRSQNWSANLVNSPAHLDPLIVVANLLSSRTIQAGALIVIITIVSTFIFGRVWCGWVCPLGTTLDFFKPGRINRKNHPGHPIPQNLRSIKYLILAGVLVAALLGNLSLLVLDPITIFYRSITISIWPALDWIFTIFEKGLYNLPFLASPINSIETWLRPAVFSSNPLYYQQALIIFLVLVGIVSLEYLAPHFWCRYLCPLGAMLGLVSKTALIRRQVKSECKGCVLCEIACPIGTIDPARGYASDPAECTMCLDCMKACPRASISFPALKPGFLWREYDPKRREFLAAIGITAISVAVLKSQSGIPDGQTYLILPPGSNQDDIFTKCVRCSECIRVCPTGGLQPSFLDSGIAGIWTPQLIPRIGYCEYSCNKCGNICPVQAIPLLALADKQITPIGTAYIDQNRCIAWADHQDCIVCEEMCPLPEKAVYLERVYISGVDQTEREIQLPHVNRDLCIGCGICEYKCPVASEAAIRVYSMPKDFQPGPPVIG